jgi:hypothetical protein
LHPPGGLVGTMPHIRRLMIEDGIGIAEEHAYGVKKTDTDYVDDAWDEL